MLAFFTLAAVSPSRQHSFRVLATCHVLMLTACGFLAGTGRMSAMFIGQTILVAGIIEGALLIGWRLTQLPKSQALEFMLVSPLRPHFVLVAEAAVGLVRLGLVTLAGSARAPRSWPCRRWPVRTPLSRHYSAGRRALAAARNHFSGGRSPGWP